MDSIGAEVGQKMRSAIKAKLMELDCYVDDELPDYIMVMVANRRTKSQMNDDLNLFLSSKTSTFVNWLHIVLKKLKEVTVTNPEVYKKAIKRKNTELPPDDKNILKIKREKAHKKIKRESERSDDEMQESSLTNDLPISTNKFADNRKIIVTNNKVNSSSENIVDDNFDIPLLSEVNDSSNEQELQDIERKIRNVKSRLGLLVPSDNEEDFVNVKQEHGKTAAQAEDEVENNTLAKARQISVLDNEIVDSEVKGAQKLVSSISTFSQDRNIEWEKVHSDQESSFTSEKTEKRTQHKRITFENDPESVTIKSRLDRPAVRPTLTGSRDRFRDRSRERSPVKNNSEKRPSILNRLGKRLGSPDRSRRSDHRQKEDIISGFRSGDFRRQDDRVSSSRSGDRRSSSKDRTNRLTERFGADRRRRDSRERSPLRSKDRNKEKEMKRDGILSRVGVQSKVAVIKKPLVKNTIEELEEKVVREVQSSIKVKPRVISSDVAQPNKNLLLKAVAEAQRSIAQTSIVRKEVKPEGLFTKKYSEKRGSSTPEQQEVSSRKLPEQGKHKLKDIIKQSSHRMRSRLQISSDEYDSDGEYIPKPVKKTEKDVPNYIPSSKSGSETESRENDTKENAKQQFIITLDGIEKLGFVDSKSSVKSRLESLTKKRSPSPIVFDKTKNNSSENKTSRPDIPDKLPILHPPSSIKNKERCRYWPSCRQGDKCEFVHPSENCQLFPQCKFGEKCLFLHPKCKFGSSCTKRDCPFDHNISKTTLTPKLPPVVSAVQNCKFFPNCVNANCPFYHPKPCKYGKYCKNIAECGFSHALVVNKKNMSWRSK